MALHCEIRTVWWDLAFLTNIVEKNFQLFYTYSEGRRPPPRKVKEEVGEWTGAQARGEGGGGGGVRGCKKVCQLSSIGVYHMRFYRQNWTLFFHNFSW